jgi:hypothetical protein
VFHALGDIVIPIERRRIAANIFTAPEIATVGWSEQDILDGKIEGVVHKLPLAANPRAKMMGITDGFVKLMARRGSGTVLGGVIVGPKASELIYPIAVAVDRRLSVDQLSRAFAVYPSLTSSITDLARSMHIVDRGPDLKPHLHGGSWHVLRAACRGILARPATCAWHPTDPPRLRCGGGTFTDRALRMANGRFPDCRPERLGRPPETGWPSQAEFHSQCS